MNFKRQMATVVCVLAAGCGGPGMGNDGAPDNATGSDVTADLTSDANTDTAVADTVDVASPMDAADSSPGTDVPRDTPSSDVLAMDGGADAAACDGWLNVPTVDPLLAVPDGGRLIYRTGAAGTQNYTCQSTATDAGGTDAAAGDSGGSDAGPVDAGPAFAWTFVGPEAQLNDCVGLRVGHHEASSGGPTAPQWVHNDGSSVVGRRVNGVNSTGTIPLLLISATAHTGSGTLSSVTYIQRLNTTGGASPSTPCDSTTVGMTQRVPYTADYYFYAP